MTLTYALPKTGHPNQKKEIPQLCWGGIRSLTIPGF